MPNSYTAITASGILDENGGLFNGTISFQPTDGANNLAGVSAFVQVTPYGGSATPGPFIANVIAGKIQSGFQVPDVLTATSSGAAVNTYISYNSVPNIAAKVNLSTPSNLAYQAVLFSGGTRPILAIPLVQPTGASFTWSTIVPAGLFVVGLGAPRLKAPVGALYAQMDGGSSSASVWLMTPTGWALQPAGAPLGWAVPIAQLINLQQF